MQKAAYCGRRTHGGNGGITKTYSGLAGMILAMKLTIVLLIAAALHVSANGVAQNVSFSGKNVSMEAVFAAVEKQTGYFFVYNEPVLESIKPVTIHAENIPLLKFLDQLFHDQPVEYTIRSKTIILSRKAIIVPPALTNNNTEQPAVPVAKPVTGRITDADGNPLSGATVSVKGGGRSTTTNAAGKFTLPLNEGDVLVVSFVGYQTKEAPVTGSVITAGSINIFLSQSTSSLDEVHIIAYGTTNRRTATGNIVKVTAADIAMQPVMNPLLALQGRVPGLVVTAQNGYESGALRVELRGRSAVNRVFTSDPLYIVDGVPLTVLDISGTEVSSIGGSSNLSKGFSQSGLNSPAIGQNPLYSINPGDIESIEVLKDADATAIYGSRGASGVILITTKRGKSGKNRFDLRLTQGITTVGGKRWDMLSTPQYLAMRREAFKNDGIVPSALPGTSYAPDLALWDTTRYTDWQKFLWGNEGKWTEVQSNYSGGNAQTNFYVSGTYNRNTSITAISGANHRAAVSLNLTTRSLDQRFIMTLASNYSYAHTNMITVGGGATLPPNAPPVFDSSGNLNYAGWAGAAGSNNTFAFGGLWSPYEAKTNFLTTNLVLSFNPVKGLTFRVSAGYNNSVNNETRFTPIRAQDPAKNPTGTANFGISRISNWIVEPQAEYNGLISKGKLTVLAGGTVQSNNTQGSLVTGTGYTNDALLYSITNAAAATSSDRYGRFKYAGIFARLGYTWNEKYVMNLNARRDGSSRFGPDNQYGNFGSVGMAWIASEENWIKKVMPSFVSFIKLRGSYGVLGSDKVGDYQYLSQWGNSPSNLPAYGGVPALTSQIQANPSFHWQQTRKMEGALNVSFLADRINVEVAYYRDRCSNQLLNFPLPEYTGFPSVTANWPATVQNSGWEYSLFATLIRNKNINWSVSFNAAANKNVLLAYPGIEQSPYVSLYRVGDPLNLLYRFQYMGVDPLTGLYAFADKNHDGIILANNSVAPGTQNDDRFVGIDLSPKFFGGFGTDFGYRNWQLRTFFNFSKQMGFDVLNTNTAGVQSNAGAWKLEDRWQKPGDITTVARFSTTTGTTYSNFSNSDGAWTDASFIRLSTLALSYRFGGQLVKKAGMTSLAINLNAQNVFVITRYKGIDPEVQNFGGIPKTRNIILGINAGF